MSLRPVTDPEEYRRHLEALCRLAFLQGLGVLPRVPKSEAGRLFPLPPPKPR
jgi:hypothetical protein